MDPGRSEPPEEPGSRRPVENGLSPELRVEKYPEKGKLLGPALSRIRSELALPLELPQDLPPGYLCHQRRSLPARPPVPGPPVPPELRASSDVLCAGHFPAGLSRLVTGMRIPAPGSPPLRRGSPPVPGGGGGAGR